MKNPAAVALGKLGGKAGTGAAKARTSEQARAAVAARWAKTKRKLKRVAQGFLSVKFTDAPHRVKWCGLRRHLTQSEFARHWQAMNAECEQLQRDNPGALFWPLEHGQDTPFLTGQTL